MASNTPKAQSWCGSKLIIVVASMNHLQLLIQDSSTSNYSMEIN
jgi:hypothetical protein